MAEAGITDPNSQEGIDFCVNHCPYDRCVVMEGKIRTPSKARKAERDARIISLYHKGWSPREIAKGMRLSERTAQRVLSQKRRHPQ